MAGVDDTRRVLPIGNLKTTAHVHAGEKANLSHTPVAGNPLSYLYLAGSWCHFFREEHKVRIKGPVEGLRRRGERIPRLPPYLRVAATSTIFNG